MNKWLFSISYPVHYLGHAYTKKILSFIWNSNLTVLCFIWQLWSTVYFITFQVFSWSYEKLPSGSPERQQKLEAKKERRGLAQYSLSGKRPTYQAMLSHWPALRGSCPDSTSSLSRCGRGDELRGAAGAHREFVYMEASASLICVVHMSAARPPHARPSSPLSPLSTSGGLVF